MNFYYTDHNGNSTGPVTRAQLQELLDTDAIPPAAQVCYEGSEEWQPITKYIHRTPSSSTSPPSPSSVVSLQPATPSNSPLRLFVAVVLAIIVGGGVLMTGWQLFMRDRSVQPTARQPIPQPEKPAPAPAAEKSSVPAPEKSPVPAPEKVEAPILTQSERIAKEYLDSFRQTGVPTTAAVTAALQKAKASPSVTTWQLAAKIANSYANAVSVLKEHYSTLYNQNRNGDYIHKAAEYEKVENQYLAIRNNAYIELAKLYLQQGDKATALSFAATAVRLSGDTPNTDGEQLIKLIIEYKQ